MIGYINRQAAPIPRESQEQKDARRAEQAKKAAELAEKIKAEAMAKLTIEQRIRFNYLDAADRQYVLVNKKWPIGQIKALHLNSVNQNAGRKNVGKRKDDVTFLQIVNAATAWGKTTFTVNSIHHSMNPKRGQVAIGKALAMYANEGKLVAIKRGRSTLYSLAVKS